MSIINCRHFISTTTKKRIVLLKNFISQDAYNQKVNVRSTRQPQMIYRFVTDLRHRRFFSESIIKNCWNCRSTKKKLNHFICADCGKIQDIVQEHDFFELLLLPRDFDVPSTELTRKFRQLQNIIHPDKFGNKSEREQLNSAEWSSLINKAYKTLSNPLDRGQYLLKLFGEEISENNTTFNKEFLIEIMSRNEEVEEAISKEELGLINDKVQDEINTEIDKLKNFFALNDLNNAKSVLVKMKYLLSIQGNIQTKLDKLLNM